MVYIRVLTWKYRIIDLPSSVISTDINNIYGGEAFKSPEDFLKLSNVIILALKYDALLKN